MKVIEFFESENKAHWLDEIRKCDWRAGTFLHELLSSGTFFDAVGEGSKVFLLTDGDKLVSFCTYAKKDDIQPTDLSPWIGFVYTFPEYRGKRCMGVLLDEIEELAKKEDISKIYISTNHVGLYEKYGYRLFGEMESIDGEMSRVYMKRVYTLTARVK
ncbi:MAG: GNAT family N-acetyltransferase [Lachnospiraceae bacterium]|nr:GNAT family N-acetyltransferase [Lachnospiraceae bacterium]